MVLTDVVIKATEELSGVIKAPPSKSYTHRAIIAASLSNGTSEIEDPLICDDTVATIKSCRMLGARIEIEDENKITVHGLEKPVTPEDVIYCGDSGSTIRFLTPVSALADGITVLTGGESLRRRPMGPLIEALADLGVKCFSTRRDGKPPIVVFGGGIKGGYTTLRGDVSSQFISGLLFAVPKARNHTTIKVEGRMESAPYVKMTVNVLEKHNVTIDALWASNVFKVPPRQEYKPFNHKIEGDYSSASFLLAAAALTNSHVKVTNLNPKSLQGDKAIIDILREINVEVRSGERYVEVYGVDGSLKNFSVDLSDNPDLFPVCSVLAAYAEGRTEIRGVKRLRFKESDRIESMCEGLRRMGVNVSVFKDSVIIEGGRPRGAIIDSYGDHRVAMAFSVAALSAEGETVIKGVECINKSYPNFLRDLKVLGAEVSER